MADIIQEGISGCSGIQVSLNLKGFTGYVGASNQTKPPARCTSPPKYHITVQCMNARKIHSPEGYYHLMKNRDK